MNEPISIERLRRWHACPKNEIHDNLRTATGNQMGFYFAAHKAMPALLDTIEKANHVAAEATAGEVTDGSLHSLDLALSRFDFAQPGDEHTPT